MRNQTKKAFSLLLALVMCLSVMSVGAFAEGNALPTADDDGVITLTEDVTLTLGLSYYGKNTILDLNGNTLAINLSSSWNARGIYVSGGSLTIQDSSQDEDGKLVVSNTNGGVTGVDIGSGTTFTMTGGEIEVSNIQYSVYNPPNVYGLKNSGTATISGGKISVTSSGVNYAVSSSGTLTVSEDAEITVGNESNTGNAPYAIYVTGGTANITGGSVIVDDHDTYGWSDDHLVYKSSGTVSVTGGKFKSPKALDYTELSKKLPSGYILSDADADGFREVVKVVAQIGNAKYTTLADAIKAAQDNATIGILNGTWGADAIGTVDNWNQIRNKSLTIQPATGATVTFTADVILGYDDCKTANATMTVTGLNFVNAKLSLDNYAYVTVEDCHFTGSGENAALYISDSCSQQYSTTDHYTGNQVTVSGCTFDGTKSGASGIRLRATGNVTLTENTVANTAHNGIMIETHGYTEDETTKVISITDNTITEWNAGNASGGGRAVRLAFSGEDPNTHVKSGPLSSTSTLTIENNYFTKATLGKDSPDFVKITDTGEATVSLENNSWNNNKLKDVNGKSAFYTVNGATITIHSVICNAASNAVAEVNGTEYETLDTAVAAASAGDTVKLLTDVTYGEDKAVDEWKKAVNIDLNGKTLTTNSTVSVELSNMGYKASAICYSLPAANAGSVKISNGTIVTAYGAGVYADDPGLTMNLEDLTITANTVSPQQTNEYSSAVRITGGAKVIIKSGSYSGYNAVAVSNSGGEFEINGGTFSGKIFFSSSTNSGVTKSITIKGGTFDNCAFVNTGKGTLTITGGNFDDDPSAYVAEGYAATKVGSYWVVAKKATAFNVTPTIGGTIDLKITTMGTSDVTTTLEVAETHPVTSKKLDDGTISVAAKDTNALIRVDGSDGTVTYFTAAEALKDIYTNPARYEANATQIAVAKATFNYGNAAAQYFNSGNTGYTYDAEDNTQLETAIDSVTSAEVAALEYNKIRGDLVQLAIGNTEHLKFLGASLVLDKNTTLRLNFEVTGVNANDYDFFIGDSDTAVKLEHRSGSYYYLTVAKSLSPEKLDDTFTVTLQSSDDTRDLGSFSAFQYIGNLLAGNRTQFTNRTDEKIDVLAKALYLHGLAAGCTKAQ